MADTHNENGGSTYSSEQGQGLYGVSQNALLGSPERSRDGESAGEIVTKRNRRTNVTTPERAEILALLKAGRTQKEVGEMFNLSQPTINRVVKSAEHEAGRRKEKRKVRITKHADMPHQQLSVEALHHQEILTGFIIAGIKAVAGLTGEMTAVDVRAQLTAMGIMPPAEWSKTQVAAAWAALITSALRRNGNLPFEFLKRAGLERLFHRGVDQILGTG